MLWTSCAVQKVLLMDEISTGLDSATTYTVVEYLRNATHHMHLTTLVSLLQPAPEVYNLFDDVLLLTDGCVLTSRLSLIPPTCSLSSDPQRNHFTCHFVCPRVDILKVMCRIRERRGLTHWQTC
jgi:ABC-type Mn2+/Zn2+ transport system ATPase subunit